MKIVHVITGLNGGGAQRPLYDLVRHTPDRFQHEVISLSNFGVIGEFISKVGVPVTALEINPSMPGIAKPRKLVQLIKDAKPDIVHTWMYHSDFLGGIAARMAGVPRVLWSVHNPDWDRRYTKFRTVMISRACAAMSGFLPDHIVYVSDRTRQIHQELGYTKKHSSVINGGYDLVGFAPSPAGRARIRAEVGIPEDMPVVGIVARFDPQKGFPYFFQMAKRLKEMRPRIHFMAVGRGVDNNPDIVKWATENGVLDSTTILGVRTDVSDVLNALDVLVSPSLGEAGPLIVGEALACGTPAVGTNVGLTDLLIGDPEFLTKPTDVEAMAMAVNKILEWDPARREAYGEQGRKRILENFSIQRNAGLYVDVYDSLVRPRSTSAASGALHAPGR